MKDVSFSESKMELEDAIQSVRSEEAVVYKNLDIVKKQTIAPLANEKNLVIKKDIEEDLLMHPDKDKLRQIILNIMSNAVKFTESGVINIKIRKSKKTVVFIIQNTGICQKLTGLLKGEIFAESKIGAGTSFTLNIPIELNE